MIITEIFISEIILPNYSVVSIICFHLILQYSKKISVTCNSSFIDPPGSPGSPKVIDTTQCSVDLSWDKPTEDGGSQITAYTIELANPDHPDQFHKVGSTSSTKYTVVCLQDGLAYRIRIKAVNSVGESEPSVIPDAVIPKEILGKHFILKFYG